MMRVKEESDTVGLKLNVQKTKIMESSLITSRQIKEEKVKVMTDFIFLGSEITADGACSHEIKRRLLLGRKTMTDQARVIGSRDIMLLTKSYIVKSMAFPVVMYGCESWTLKKAEH